MVTEYLRTSTKLIPMDVCAYVCTICQGLLPPPQLFFSLSISFNLCYRQAENKEAIISCQSAFPSPPPCCAKWILATAQN